MDAGDAVVEWLISLGFPDRAVARSAAQQLATPQLKSLWQLLQTRLLTSADGGKLQSLLKLQTETPGAELLDLQLQLDKLDQQINECKQQISIAQVC